MLSETIGVIDLDNVMLHDLIARVLPDQILDSTHKLSDT